MFPPLKKGEHRFPLRNKRVEVSMRLKNSSALFLISRVNIEVNAIA